MPLLDHFRPPISRELRWESFNTVWAVNIMRCLNRTLPKDRFRAQAHVHLGSQVEADVAEYERPASNGFTRPDDGGVATLSEIDAAVATVDAVFPDEYEVAVVDATDIFRVVGVIELVSPGNKKEAGEREAFVAKCAAYLQRGIGLVVIDAVTDRRANLHNELVRRLGTDQPPALLPDEPLYAAGYRPVRRKERNLIELWPKPLALGQPLPKIPFPLKGGPTISLDLEGTYTETLTDSGL